MILLWIKLLFIHRGYALMSVTTVKLGESVSFACSFPETEYSNTRIKWYKQDVGDTLALITTLMKSTSIPTFGPGFPSTRFNVNHTTTSSILTIHNVKREDEAVYHCAVTTWSKDIWIGSYLFLKENSQRMSNYTVVQQMEKTDLVHPGDSVTLQCSVFSGSESSSCEDNHSVYWYGVRSSKSVPNTIYVDRNNPNKCEKKHDGHSRSCVYRFSKNIRPSDAGTYYCAVASCGEILFGNGTKVDIEGTGPFLSSKIYKDNTMMLLLCAVLAISIFVIAFLIYVIMKIKCEYCNAADSLQENITKRNLKGDEDTLIYSAVVFTMMTTTSGREGKGKSTSRERIYAAVKAFGLD